MATTPGANPSADYLNQLATQIAQALDANATRALVLAKYVDKIDIAGLQAAGFAATADAQAFKTAVDYLKTVAMIFTGQAATPQFDFSDALAPYIGPAPAA